MPTSGNTVPANSTQLDRVLKAYVDRFGCNFPIYAVGGIAEDRLLTLIKSCMENDQPYTPRYKNSADY